MLPICTCGCTEPHVIATRRTADGYTVQAWSDGPVTAALGMGIRGLPIVRPRTAEALDTAKSAASLFMGEVSLWDLAEAPALYAACRKVAAAGGLPGDVRAEMRRRRERAEVAAKPLCWVVEATHPDGSVKRRSARLPRLLYAGLWVIDYCGSDDSRGARYHLVSQVSGGPEGTVQSTGFTFRNLADMWKHLES